MEGAKGVEKPQARFVAGDGIRGYGVLTVFLVHAALAVTLPRGDWNFESFGAAQHVLLALDPVIISFFALSGYLIARPFVKSLVLGRKLRAPQYVRRRAARIVPAYALALVATIVFLGTRDAPTSEILTVAGLLQAWDATLFETQLMQGWTLSVEAFFYFVLPLSALALAALLAPMRSLTPERRAAILIGLLGVVAVLSFAVAVWREGVQENQLPLAHMWAFTPGMALAAIEFLPLRDRLPRWIPAAALLVTAAGFVWLLFVDHANENVRLIPMAMFGCGPFVGALVRHWQGGKPWRIMRNPVILWVGERSYGLYLCHSIVLSEVLSVTDGRGSWTALGLLTLVALPISLVIAALSWSLIEKHAIAWSHRRPEHPSPSTPDPAPAPATAVA